MRMSAPDLGGVNPVNRRAHARSPRLRQVVRRAGALALALAFMALLVDHPASVQAGTTTLVSNTAVSGTVSLSISREGIVQGFSTGGHPAGYVVHTVDLVHPVARARQYDLSIWRADANGRPTSRVTENFARPSSYMVTGTVTFRAPPDTRLDASSNYSLVLSGGTGRLSLGTTSSDDEDAGSASGWTITNSYQLSTANGWTGQDYPDSLRIAVKGQTLASLTSNLGQAPESTADFADAASVRFLSGGRYTLTSVVIDSADAAGDDFDVSIWTSDAMGLPSEKRADFTRPSSFAAGELEFRAPPGSRVDNGGAYVIVIEVDGAEPVTLQTTTSDAEDAGGPANWGIGDDHGTRSGSTWSVASGGATLKIRVNGFAGHLPGAPGDPRAELIEREKVRLQWMAAGTGTTTTTGYQVDVSTDAGASWSHAATLAATATSHIETRTGPFDDVRYRVSATSELGQGVPSDPLSVETGGAVLVSNFGQTVWSTATSQSSSQTFRAGTRSNITSIDVHTTGGNRSFSASLWTVDADRLPSEHLINLEPPSSFASGTVTFTVPGGGLNTSVGAVYAFVLAPTSNMNDFRMTTSTADDAGAETNWAIDDQRGFQSAGVWQSASGSVLRIQVRGFHGNVPGAPTGLTAEATGPSGIALSWTAPTSTGSTAIAGYRIEVSTDGSAWTDLVANTGSTDTTYAHTGLPEDSTRHYRVSAINTIGAGDPSGTVTITTTSDQGASTDASLSALSVSPKDIVGIAADKLFYEMGVDYDVTTVTVAATLNDSNAQVVISPADADAGAAGHQVSLAAGSNLVAVTVTAQDGASIRVYRVHINRGSAATFAHRAGEDFYALGSDGVERPTGIWSDGTTMWVADGRDDKLYAYKMSDKSRDSSRDFDTLSAAGNDAPTGIWSDGTTMWVADRVDGKLYAYKLSDRSRDSSQDFDTLSAAGNENPTGIWSDGTTMWVADLNDGKLYAYRMSDKSRDSLRDFDTLSAAGNGSPYGIWSDETTMWVVDLADDKLYAYRMSDKSRNSSRDFDTLSAAGNDSPTGIWSDETTMWVADPGDGKLYAYKMSDKSRDSSRDFDTLSAAGNDFSFGIWSDGTTMWVADQDDGKLYAYRMSDKSRDSSRDFDTLSAAGNDFPYGIWSDGTTMWVADLDDDQLYSYWLTLAPAAPAAPTVSAVSGSDTSLAVSWTAPSNTGKPAITSFDLRYRQGSSGSWTNGPQDVSGTSSTITGLTEGESYQVQVRATNAEGDSPWSSSGTGTTTNSFAAFGHQPGKDLNALGSEGITVPWGLWSNGTTMWVVDTDSVGINSKVHAYVLASGARDSAREFDLHADNRNGKGTWSDGTTMWVVDSTDAKVYAYVLPDGESDDGARDSAREFDLHADNGRPRGMWSDRTTMWVADLDDDKVYAYTLATGARDSARDFDLDADNSTAKGMWSNGTTMWVVDSFDDKLFAYRMTPDADRGDRDLSREFPLVADNGSSTGVWSDGETMWVADLSDDKLFAYRLPSFPSSAWVSGRTLEIAFSQDLGAAADLANSAFSVTMTPSGGRVAPVGLTGSPVIAGRTVILTLAEKVTDAAAAVRVSYTRPTMGSGNRLFGVNGAVVSSFTDLQATVTLRVTGGRRASGRDITLDTANADPRGIWSDETTMWVADADDGKIYAYSVSGQRDLAKDFNTLSAAGNANPTGIWSDETTMWVADADDGKIYAYKLSDKGRDAEEDVDILTMDGVDQRRPLGLWSYDSLIWAGLPGGEVFAYDLRDRGGSNWRGYINRLNGNPGGSSNSWGVWGDGTTMWVSDQGGHPSTPRDGDERIFAFRMSGDKRGEPGRDFDTLVAAGNGSPRGIWSNGTTMWVVDDEDKKLYAYDHHVYAVSAWVTGRSLVVEFNQDLVAAPALANRSFVVTRTSRGVETLVQLGGSPVISGKMLTLTLPTELDAADSGFTVTYLAPHTGSGNRLAGARGVEVSTFGRMPAASFHAPVGLQATARSQTRIDLSWQASPGVGAQVTGYRIEISTDGIAWTDLVPNTGSSTTSYAHTNLTSNSTWYYRVSAINSIMTGKPSKVERETANVLVSNAHQLNDHPVQHAIIVRPGQQAFQMFMTGSDTNGYTLASIEITTPDWEGDDFRVEVWATYNPGRSEPEDPLNHYFPDWTTDPLIKLRPGEANAFTAPPGKTLDPDMIYAVVAIPDGGESLTIREVTTADEDAGAASGWSIADRFMRCCDPGFSWISPSAMPIKIRGSVKTAQGAPANAEARGAPAITGTVEAGETLTADTSGISDADGMENATFRYQWLANGSELGGATGQTYTVGELLVGRVLSVRVTFTDDAGNEESLTSEETEAVVDVHLTLESATVDGATLRLRYSELLNVLVDLPGSAFTVMVNGTARTVSDSSVTGSTVTLTLAFAVVAGDTVTVGYEKPTGNRVIGDLRGRVAESFSGQAVTNNTPPPLTATVSEVPASHDGSAAFTFELRFSDEFDLSYVTLRDHAFTVTGGSVRNARRLTQGSNVGWEITVEPSGNGTVTVELPIATDCEVESAICADDGRKLSNLTTVTVPGPGSPQEEMRENNPATGAPAISGTAQVGETLTVSTAGIADADGLTNVSYTYQWLADDTEISGATGSTYTLVSADQGKAIKVRVSFTDDAGNAESLTSAATAAVAAANNPATGIPAISGTAQVGETLTVSTAGIADADGLTNVSYTYQWLADDTEISGATGSTYTLVSADQGKAIKVRVSFTDDAGNAESLTSAATAAVAAANNPATGIPAISGTAQVGETLTVSTAGIADADGLTNVSYTYQWLADGAVIAGATGSSYTLAAADRGKAIKARVSFTDDAGNAESLTSAATAAVAPPPLTASASQVPASHHGSAGFTFQLHFSEEFDLSYVTLRDHAFEVAGGSVRNARRLNPPSNVGWEITVEPSGNGPVTIVLPVTADCAAQGAICTGDGRKLSNETTVAVAGP